MIKENQKKESKNCGICQLPILIPGEEYVDVAQYAKDGKHFKTGSYHLNCFKERYLINKKVEREGMAILSKAKNMLNQVAGERA